MQSSWSSPFFTRPRFLKPPRVQFVRVHGPTLQVIAVQRGGGGVKVSRVRPQKRQQMSRSAK